MNALLVAVGGGLGSLCRYGLSLAAVRLAGPHFPAGTLAANLIGCLAIGVVFGLAERTALVSPGARLFLVTGFLGGLTTFSSYAVETVGAARDGATAVAVANILATNAFGLSLVVAGMLAVRRVF